uniref:Uncharacterized protein n=1 Tax=Rhizophora mucronata TaxID=61149 RepID=A0A2P2LDH5_RHIMU
MKPVTAAFTLNHEVIWIVWHLAFAIHSNSIGIESASSRIVLETAEEVVVSDGVKLRVALETVHRTLALDSVGALYIVVIGEEYFLGAVELAATADRLLRPVVPPDVDLDVGSSDVRFDRLDLCHVGRLHRFRRSH